MAALISANDAELIEFMSYRSTIVDLRDALRLLKTVHTIPKLTSKRKETLNKHYLGKLNQAKLNYQILKYSGEAFREVIDQTHPHPDIFQDKDFQSVVFGNNIGQIGEIRSILNQKPKEDDIIKLMETYNIPWHYLKQRVTFTDKIYLKLIETESLPVILRRLRDFRSYIEPIEKKLLQTENLKMNFFELYEIWKSQTFSTNGQMHLVQLCEAALKDSTRNLTNLGKVAIVGDISPSMNFAAEFSIMLSLVLGMAYKDASLYFFSSDCENPALPPSFYGATQMVAKTHTKGGTAPGTVPEFWEKQKETFDTVIIITDEQENRQSHRGWSFAQEWHRYILRNPLTKLLFLSVGRDQSMTRALDSLGHEFVRVSIPEVASEGFKILQALLVSLAHPGLFEIKISAIEHALKNKPVQEVQFTVNKERSFFILSELIVTIKDLCALSGTGNRTFEKEIRTESTKLAIVLKSLGFVSDETALRNLDYGDFDTVELFLEELTTKIKLM